MTTNPEVESADKDQSKPQATEFEQQAEEAIGLVTEFMDFLVHNKKWWLTPIIIVIALFGILTYFAGSVAAPFIYPFI